MVAMQRDSHNRQSFEQISCEFVGEFNTSAFQIALDQLFSSQPILRSSFDYQGIEPLQIVHQEYDISISLEDWCARELDKEQALIEFVENQRAIGFGLEEKSLHRFFLIRLDQQRTYFLWCQDHRQLDGWSLPIVLKQLFAFYNQALQGKALEPINTAQVDSYYLAYLDSLAKQDAQLDNAFWKEQLAELNASESLPLLGLSATDGKNRNHSYDSQRFFMRLGIDDSDQIRHFCRSQNITIATLVQGAWALLLSQSTDTTNKDIEQLFGVTLSGRDNGIENIQHVVGMMINTLPLRVSTNSDQNLGDWLRSIQSNVNALQKYTHCSLAEIQSIYQSINQNNPNQPLINTAVVVENYPVESSMSDEIDGFAISNVNACLLYTSDAADD